MAPATTPGNETLALALQTYTQQWNSWREGGMADFRPPAFLSPPFTPSSMMSLTMPPISPALSNFSSRGMGSDDWGVDSISIPDSAGGSGAGREDRRHAPRSSNRGSGNGNGTKHSPRGLKTGLSADSGHGQGHVQGQARADGASAGEAEACRVMTTPALIMSSLSSPRSSSGGGGLESNSLDSREGSWRLEDGEFGVSSNTMEQ